MISRIQNWLKSLFDVEPQERVKLVLLTLTFFCIIGGYTLAKELKDSVFSAVVGRIYIPQAKMYFMIFMVPAIFLYSKLVDRLRRYRLLCWYAFFYALVGFVCVYMLGHPTIGLLNTDSSPYRVFGWLFYFFVESWSPFVVSVFWAFLNSISNPDTAKNSYGTIVAGSKFGGMLTSGFAWALLSVTTPTSILIFSDVVKHQILLGVSSLLILCVPVIILVLMRKVSGHYLHGYEAAYQVEKNVVRLVRQKQGFSQV